MVSNHKNRHRIAAIAALVIALPLADGRAQPSGGKEPLPGKQKYRGLLGAESKKIRHDGDKTFIWAGGGSPTSPDADWYDFTGSVIPAGELQFGIGKDRIRSIDDPVFVSPDDPRLLKLPGSRYRPDERPKTNDEIMITGFVQGEVARAYPIGLLDRHELVNDFIGGKPVTVGW